VARVVQTKLHPVAIESYLHDVARTEYIVASDGWSVLTRAVGPQVSRPLPPLAGIGIPIRRRHIEKYRYTHVPFIRCICFL